MLNITSCQLFNKDAEEEALGAPVARVFDRYLYEDELSDLIPVELGENDSLAFVQNYINVWAKDQLMIYKAEYNLTENKKNFEEQIKEYRNDLLKFAYRQEYIRQNLDTNIAESALERYYHEEESNFLLKENILQANYIIVNRDAPDLEKAVKWFKSDKPRDRREIEDYALKYAYKFALADSSWVTFDRLAEMIPLETGNPAAFLQSNQLLEYRDSTNVYLVEIFNYRLKGDQAPLEYSRNVIKNILINKRKLELINNLEQNLLNDALEKKEFEVY